MLNLETNRYDYNTKKWGEWEATKLIGEDKDALAFLYKWDCRERNYLAQLMLQQDSSGKFLGLPAIEADTIFKWRHRPEGNSFIEAIRFTEVPVVGGGS